MARFRRGDLILNSTKKIQIDDAEISDNGSQLEINKPLKTQGIQLASGEEITTTGDDTTSSLISSSIVRSKMNQASSGLGEGVDAVGVIINPREDIKGSSLVYGGSGIEYVGMSGQSYDTFNAVATTVGGSGGGTLKSGLIVNLIGGTSGLVTVEYKTEDGDVLSSVTTTLDSSNIYASTYDTPAAMSNGGCAFSSAIESGNQYLHAVSPDGSILITEQMPSTLFGKYSVNVLPNDDIIVSYQDTTNDYIGRFRADFDASSFIEIQAFTSLGAKGTPIFGSSIIYLGSNKVLVVRQTTLLVVDLETYTVTNSVVVTKAGKAVITPDRKIVTIAMTGATVYLNIFDIDLNPLVVDASIGSGGSIYPSTNIHPEVLPNGNILFVYYSGSGGDIGYSIIDSNGTLIEEDVILTSVGSSDTYAQCSIFPNGKILINGFSAPNLKNYIFNPGLKTSSGLSISGTTYNISSDIYANNELATADAIQDTRKYKNAINPSNWMPYITLPGKVDGRELGDKWIGRYSYPFMTCYSASYIASNIFPGTNKAIVFYSKAAANDPKYAIINIDTNEYTEYDLDAPSGTSATVSKPTFCFMTKSGIALGVFEDTTNDYFWIEAINVNGESVAYKKVFGPSEMINWAGFGVLENDRILIRHYPGVVGGPKIAQFEVDIDSSSFIQITDWETADVLSFTLSSYPIYDMGNGELLLASTGGEIAKIDIHGSIASSYALNSYISVSQTIFANNLIYSFGGYAPDGYEPKILIQDRNFNIIKQETIDNPDSLSAYSIQFGRPCALGNGTVIFSFRHLSGSYKSYLYIVEPDLTGKFVRLLNSNVVVNINPIQPYPYKDGFVIIGNHSDKKTTVITYERDPKDKSIRNNDPGIRANAGAMDLVPIKYTKRNIYSNTGADSQQKNIGIFNNGRIVLFENVSSDIVYSILEADGTIVIDRRSLFLGYQYTAVANTRIEDDNKQSVFSFKDRNWVMATFKDNSTYERVTVVIDSEGNQPCYPRYYSTTGSSGCSTCILDNGNIVIGEYDSAGVMGSGSYLGMWKVDTDSSSIVAIINPFRTTESYMTGPLTQISKNRLVYWGTEFYILSTRTLGMVDRYASPYSGRSVWDRRIVVTPNNKIIFTCWAEIITSQEYDIYARIFSFDSDNDKITYDQEVFLYKTQSFYTPATMVWDDNGYVLFYGINFNHKEPRASHRANGILMMDEAGNKLNLDDYINYDDANYTTWGILNKGANGSLYVIKNEATATYTQIDKWGPVTKKESPLRTNEYVYEYVYDGTTYITLSMVNLGQTITNSDSTSEIIIPSNSNDPLPIGFHCKVVRLNGQITFVTDGGSASIVSKSSNVSLRTTGSTAKIIKVAADTWLLTGDLA